MRIPVIELSDCILCEICVVVCPEVFRLNAAGYIEVAELSIYPIMKVDEAVMSCPTNCIFWIKP